MSLIRYTSYPLSGLQQQINRMFDQFDNQSLSSEGLGGGMFTPAVDVKEDGDAYTVDIEVPGVAQDKLQINLQDNVLTVRGHKEQKTEQTQGQFRRVERSYGSFTRSLTLPRNVESTGVTALLSDGVLQVRLPKQASAKPQQIQIDLAQGNGVHASNGAPAEATPQPPSEANGTPPAVAS